MADYTPMWEQIDLDAHQAQKDQELDTEPQDYDWVTKDYKTFRQVGSNLEPFTVQLVHRDYWAIALNNRMQRDQYYPNLWYDAGERGIYDLIDVVAEREKQSEELENLHKIRIVQGCQFLDEIRPYWCRQLNLETLRLDNCYKCVLGQLCNSYGEEVRQHFPAYEDHDDTRKRSEPSRDSKRFYYAVRYGRNLFSYDKFTDLWKKNSNPYGYPDVNYRPIVRQGARSF